METPTTIPSSASVALPAPSAAASPTRDGLGDLPVYMPPPASIRYGVAIAGLSAIGLASSALFFCFTADPEPLLALAGVQSLTLLGGLFAALWSRKRPSHGPVLALLCAGGAVLTGAGLGVIAHSGSLGPAPFKWWALSEGLLALSVLSAALLTAVARHPDAKIPFIKGVILALPAFVIAFLVLFGGRIGFSSRLDALPTLVRLSVTFVAGLGAAVALCMAAHHLAISFSLAHRAGRKPA
jgi:hypothetical protein